MQQMIVDGYNVIHSDPALRTDFKISMERARNGLLERIGTYVDQRSVRVTVVFDGAGGLTDVDVLVPGRLQALYSASGQSADDLILETLQRDGNPRRYIVVTSDISDIGRAAKSMGATLMSSPDFLQRIAPPRPAARDAREEVGADASDDADVEYWLSRFRARDSDPGRDN